MIPTPKLRFVDREIQLPIQGFVVTYKTVRILQQWWEPKYNIIDVVADRKTGEWRDVPVEDEQA